MKIVVIGAMWCPACIKMKNIWEDFEFSKSNIEFEKLDLDFNETECEKYKPGEILPVIIFFENGVEVSRLIGEKNKEEILEEIERLM